MQTKGRWIQQKRARFNENWSLVQRIQEANRRVTKNLANERTKECRITGVTWGWELNRRRNKEWGNNTDFRTNWPDEGDEVQVWRRRRNSGDRAGLMNQTEHRCGGKNQAAEEHQKTGRREKDSTEPGNTHKTLTHNETKTTGPGPEPGCHDLQGFWRCLCADVTEGGDRCVTRHAVDPLTSMDDWPVMAADDAGSSTYDRAACYCFCPVVCVQIMIRSKGFHQGGCCCKALQGELLSLLTSADRVV